MQRSTLKVLNTLHQCVRNTFNATVIQINVIKTHVNNHTTNVNSGLLVQANFLKR